MEYESFQIHFDLVLDRSLKYAGTPLQTNFHAFIPNNILGYLAQHQAEWTGQANELIIIILSTGQSFYNNRI